MLGLDRFGMDGVPVEQPILEAAEPEEVVLLLVELDGGAVDRTQTALEQLVVGVVLLAADAVLAAIGPELDVAGVIAPLEQFEHCAPVTRLGGADEVVVGDVQAVPGM